MSGDRAALYEHAEAYLDALTRRDPSRLAWADDAVLTENNVRLAVGDGTWATVDRRRGYDLKMADPASGQVAWFGVIEEHGHPAIMALRLKIAGDRIAEAETIVTRKVENSPFPSIDTYIQPRPLMLADVPAGQRTSRTEMLALANGYFETIQLNDGTIRTRFAANCHRIENGMETAADGCEKAFRLGVYRFNARVRDRDYLVVDEARGLVMARAYIDHKGALDHYRLTDGTDRRSPFREPHTWSLMETFKIENGAVGPIETDFIGSPYFTRSPWTVRPDCPCSPWLRREAR